jgi:homospermidine synthase
MLPFSKRILFVGFGAVARCTLPILLKHIGVDPKRITIIDFEPNDAALKPWIEDGVIFLKDRVTPENMGTLLGQHLSAGDLLVDLAWNIDCCEIVQWCHDRGVLYVNTSVELWDPYGGANNKHPTERTLYWRYMKLRRMIAGWSEPGPRLYWSMVRTRASSAISPNVRSWISPVRPWRTKSSAALKQKKLLTT